jgi:hypothetical protein
MTSVGRRRAQLRGDEAVARWRIGSAVWGARLFAALFAVTSTFPLLDGGVPDWGAAGKLFALAVFVFTLGEWTKRGSRIAALLLFAAVIAAKLRSWVFLHERVTYGLFWTLVLFGASASGVWGTFALAAARRESSRLARADQPPLAGL